MRIEAVELVAEVCCQRAIERRRPKVVFRQIDMVGIGLVNEAAVGKRFGKVDFDRDFVALCSRSDVLTVGQNEILCALSSAAGGKRQGGGNREEAHYRLPFGIGSLLLLLKISALGFSFKVLITG